MVEISTSQAIPSMTTDELNGTRIIEQIIHLGNTNTEQRSKPAGAVVTLLAQVDHCNTPKFDQPRVAVVSVNGAPTTQTFQAEAAPNNNTVTLTKSASIERSDTYSKLVGSTGIDLCKNIFSKEQTNSISTSNNNNNSPNRDLSPQPSTSPSSINYQLRALKGDKSSIEEDNLWSKNFNVPNLSSDLIDETLNYFVNCRHRLTQITKTFDDSDAYILLLQEKEMDLELVARIGQDLLKQFNEVKDSNEALKDELAKFQELNEKLKDELAKCREDNQQLRYELASKVSLLDTFMEEEEEHSHQRDAATSALNRFEANEEEFHSLRSQSDRVVSSNETTLYKRLCELQDELLTKDEILFKQNVFHQERNIHLEMQLRESDRRLSGLEAENEALRENQRELYEELKTYSRNFAELLRIFSESQQYSRAHDVGNISFDSFTEQTESFDSHLNSLPFIHNLHQDTQRHHQTCYNQIGQNTNRGKSSGMVMSSSLHEELQESLLKSGELSLRFNNNVDDDEITQDEHNEAEDEGDGSDPVIGKISPTSSPGRHHRNYHKQSRHQPNYYQSHHIRRRNNDSDSGGVSDGADSGLHTTTTISTSTTPINNGLNQETDSDLDASISGASASEKATSKKHWLGISTFTLTTLLLICLSATLNNTTNSNLAQKLQQIKFER